MHMYIDTTSIANDTDDDEDKTNFSDRSLLLLLCGNDNDDCFHKIE